MTLTHCGMATLTLLAFTALALAMDRHQAAVLGRALSRGANLCLRAMGWLCLTGSLLIAFRAPSPWLAVVAWFGHLTVSAGVVLIALVAHARCRG